jgi:guanylate kinase
MSNIFLITAPSGAGKTTLAQALAKMGYWEEVISHTTREMRKGEVDGKTYYYVSENQFMIMEDNDEFAERVTYKRNRYGVSKREIERVLNKGKDVFIIVEHDGYKQIKRLYPEAIGIFLYMSKEDCLANMLIRGDKIQNALDRIELYDSEMLNAFDYDYVIKNVRDKQVETENILISIIKQYKKLLKYNLDISSGIKVDTTPMPIIGGSAKNGKILFAGNNESVITTSNEGIPWHPFE